MTLRPIIADTLQPLRHGFFTRQGGQSTGIYASLNCGPGSGDAADAVAANRAVVARELGLAPESLVSLHQIHSAEVVRVDAPFAERPRADAMVTDRPGIGLAVLTADCAPVLLADAQAGVIGAAHAGWRGALAGVIEAVLAAMRGLGARDITAVIGPCISQREYEVGPEFVETFLDADPDFGRHFAGGAGDRAQFDLPGFVLARLRSGGAEAEWTGHCTCSDPERFFSYRRTTRQGAADYGRLVSVIRL
ncbi:MAG: peptidoglycan editing factor PgeF [Alphaproteobacteria bacterium]|nr:MAG: peptidoglycan editing factor PgeF [Alphaproteobacteria bacterium]